MTDPDATSTDPTLHSETVSSETVRTTETVAPETLTRSRSKVIVIVAVLLAVAAFLGVWALVNSLATPSSDPVVSESEAPAGETPTDQLDGVVYENAEYGFTVVFPGAPTQTTQKLPIEGYDIDLTSALYQEGQSALAANATRYPEELLSEVEVMLDGSVEGAIANVPGAELVSSTPTTLDGLPAREVLATTPGGDLHMFIAIDTDVQYQLLALGVDEITENSFFGSFRLG